MHVNSFFKQSSSGPFQFELFNDKNNATFFFPHGYSRDDEFRAINENFEFAQNIERLRRQPPLFLVRF